MRSRLLAFVLICLAISSYLQLSQPISCYLPLSLPSLSHLSDMSDYLQPTKTISSFFKPTHAISSHLSLFLATSGHLQQFQSIFIYLSMLLFLDLEIHFNVHSTFSSILGPCLQLGSRFHSDARFPWEVSYITTSWQTEGSTQERNFYYVCIKELESITPKCFLAGRVDGICRKEQG